MRRFEVEADIARQMLDGSLSEFDWQSTVIDEATRLSWELHYEPGWYWRAIHSWLKDHPYAYKYMDRAKRGWPDLTLWHTECQRLIFAELKTETGTVEKHQRERLETLWHAGAEVYVWRPRDRDQVDRILRCDPREDDCIVYNTRTKICRPPAVSLATLNSSD
jgi:hypothetical protein